MKFILGFFLLVVSVSAQALTTKDLMEICDTDDKFSALGSLCLGFSLGLGSELAGYAAGYIEASKNYKSLEKSEAMSKLRDEATAAMSSRYGCILDKKTEQTISVFVKWAKAHPEKWHLPAEEGYKHALREAFPPPC